MQQTSRCFAGKGGPFLDLEHTRGSHNAMKGVEQAWVKGSVRGGKGVSPALQCIVRDNSSHNAMVCSLYKHGFVGDRRGKGVHLQAGVQAGG